MKNKIKNACKELFSNRGSGLAFVMMAMTFLSLLATTLLNMTYMGYKIKAEDRQQKTDFYIVNTAMDEIRAGLQVTASDAIAEAYETVLVNFDTTNTELEENFKNYFFQSVEEQIEHSLWPGKYDSNVLKDMIKTGTSIEIENSLLLCRLEKNTEEIVLHNVSLTYTNSAGNEITLKTDIIILAPSFASAEWNYDELVQYRNWSAN